MFQFVNPSATMITEADHFKRIEAAGRTCYKSEDRITDTSARGFVRGLMNSRHTAMVEHAVFVFDVSHVSVDVLVSLNACPYINLTLNGENGRALASGNLRAINEQAAHSLGAAMLLKALFNLDAGLVYENELMSDCNVDDVKIVDIDTIPNLSAHEIEQHKHLTFRLITDRGVTHELVRHRPPSYGMESTRYVNYLAGISICLPTGFYEKPEVVQEEYQLAFQDADNHYRRLIELGEKPQQARAVLPTALKTEIVVTTNIKEWNHIWNLRLFGTTGAPHPDIKALMEQVYAIAGTDQTVAKYLAMKEAA